MVHFHLLGFIVMLFKFNVGLVDKLKDLGHSKAPDICLITTVITSDDVVMLTQSMCARRPDNQWVWNFARTGMKGHGTVRSVSGR